MAPALQEVRSALTSIEAVLETVDRQVQSLRDAVSEGVIGNPAEIVPMLDKIKLELLKVTG